MTETTLNIFDIMQTAPSKTTSGQSGLLESLGQTELQNSEMQENSFDMIFGNMLESIPTDPTNHNEALLQNALMQENQIFAQLPILGQTNNVEQIVIDENILLLHKNLEEIDSQDHKLQNLNIKEIFANQDIELENGQFKVLSKEIVDSKVSLTIESKSGKQLQISLPIESIQNQTNYGMSKKVSLTDSYYQKELESLIDKVDIKHIEIKSAETKVSQSALKPVEISLVGEQNSTAVNLKASLKKNQIKITKSQATTSHQKAAVLDESGLFDEKQILKPQMNNNLIEKISVDNNGQITGSFSKMNQQLSLNNNALNQSNEQVMTNFNVIGADTIENVEVKENIQNVRMQLPENIKSVLRPNSQAIVIKLNPENLGPAKLSLSFSNGKLRAKLVVTSVNAKQMLDGSMSRLVDQLQKIDINVEKIDVMFDDSQNQNDNYNQKQQWQQKMSHKNIDLTQFEENKLAQIVQEPVMSAMMATAPGSVNYLA